MSNKKGKLLYSLRGLSIGLGIMLGVLSSDDITILADEPESYTQFDVMDIRTSLSNAIVPNDTELAMIESKHVTLATQDSMLDNTGYLDLVEDANTVSEDYDEYVKEQKRLAEEARKKRLAEEAKKKRLAEEARRERLRAEAKENADYEITLEGKKYTAMFEVTAYCTCKECCGKWSPEVTGEVSHTASGTVPCEGRTVAVDTDIIPFGSVVVINGHEYIAEDTGSAVKGNIIDIFMEDHDRTNQWGRQNLEVTYYIK